MQVEVPDIATSNYYDSDFECKPLEENEEVELFKSGAKFAYIGDAEDLDFSYPGVDTELLTQEEERELFIRLREKELELETNESAELRDEIEDIKSTLVVKNIGLVYEVAINIYKTWNCGNFTLEDVIMSGFAGLTLAINRFDLTYNTRFFTYAYWYVKKYIREDTMNLAFDIRLPTDISYLLTTIQVEVQRKEEELERPLDSAETLDIVHRLNDNKVSTKRLLKLYRNYPRNVQSLGILPYEPFRTDTLEQTADENLLIEKIFQSEKLNLEQKYILLLRYQDYTCEEIGQMLPNSNGISREAVSQKLETIHTILRRSVEV